MPHGFDVDRSALSVRQASSAQATDVHSGPREVLAQHPSSLGVRVMPAVHDDEATVDNVVRLLKTLLRTSHG